MEFLSGLLLWAVFVFLIALVIGIVAALGAVVVVIGRASWRARTARSR